MNDVPITISEYCNVSEKAMQLGLNLPTGLALLPRNFDSASNVEKLLHESSVTTIRVLFRREGIVESKIEPQGVKIPCVQENDFSLLLPTLFVAGSLWSQDANAVALAINIISSYVVDFFKGVEGGKKVKFDLVVEDQKNKTSRRIHYEGSPEAFPEVRKIVGKVFTNEK